MIAVSECDPPPRGYARVVVARDRDRSVVTRLRAESPLRVLTPRGEGHVAWIVTSTFGGGIVGGDAIELALSLGDRTTTLLTSQSSTKVYRGASSQTTRATLGEDATLLSLPDPLVPFAGASFAQRATFHLAPSSSLLLVDIFTAGRVARAERWAFSRLSSTLAIDVAGGPLLRDALLLDPLHGALATRMERFDAVATIVLLGPKLRASRDALFAALTRDRPLRDSALVSSASPLGDGLFARVGATTIAALLDFTRELLSPVCALAGDSPWSRKW
jgi:urease accessory protein